MANEEEKPPVDAEKENGEPPAKKKRGRKPKRAPPPAKDDTEATSDVAETEAADEKRGPGRPRTSPGEKKVRVSSGRPRGRPKGSVNKTTVVPLASERAKSGSRQRGRPRKAAGDKA